LVSKDFVDIDMLTELGLDLAFELGPEKTKKGHVGLDD